MKITLVTETFSPEINGVSMTLGRLVDGLSRRGFNMTVVAPTRKDRVAGDNECYQLVMAPGLPIPRYTDLRFGLPAHGRLRRLWSGTRPDLVHIATEGPLGWSALRTARRMGLKVVSSFHTNFHSYGEHYGYGFVNKLVLNWMKGFHNKTLRTFVPSNDLIEQISKTGFQNLKLFARGVDTQLFGPHRRNNSLRENWGADAETPVALYVGRLAGEKNLKLVVTAFRKMQQSLPRIKLVLVGDGPERGAISKECPEAVFAGMQRGEALAEHYASADCFLFASITETFGNVVTEAMSSSLPVLAYDYAAPGRFIESGVNGILAPYNDADAFESAAGLLAGQRPSWPVMGAAARKTMLPHSWDRIVDDYVREIQSLN
jgi:glycosyltransferase involved in cell wall biosynthesis